MGKRDIREMLKSELQPGRVAGTGVIEDHYGDEDWPDGQSNHRGFRRSPFFHHIGGGDGPVVTLKASTGEVIACESCDGQTPRTRVKTGMPPPSTINVESIARKAVAARAKMGTYKDPNKSPDIELYIEIYNRGATAGCSLRGFTNWLYVCHRQFRLETRKARNAPDYEIRFREWLKRGQY